MTTSSDPTNTTHECVSDCVPECVSQAARAPASRVRPPSPSTTWGDALSEPSALRPHDRVSGPLDDGAEPHVQQPPAETPWDEVRARLDAATPGPWEADGYDVHETKTAHGDVVAEAGLSTADAEFIARARSDVAALLAAYDGLVVQLGEVRANRDRLAHEVARLRAELHDGREALRAAIAETSIYHHDIHGLLRAAELVGLRPPEVAGLDGAHPTPSDGSGT